MTWEKKWLTTAVPSWHTDACSPFKQFEKLSRSWNNNYYFHQCQCDNETEFMFKLYDSFKSICWFCERLQKKVYIKHINSFSRLELCKTVAILFVGVFLHLNLCTGHRKL